MNSTNQNEFDAFVSVFSNQSRFFPIAPGTKVPMESGWQTTVYDPALVSDDLTFGGINAGYKISASDLVIDIDVQALEAGVDAETFIQLFIREWKLEAALRSRTPSGGVHIFLKKDPGVKIKVHSQRYGKVVEFKSAGTYVVVPGSVTKATDTHVGGSYSIDHPGELGLLAPEGLLDLVRKEAPGGAGRADVVTADELNAMLWSLDASEFDDNESWLKVAMAVHSGSGGEGVDEFARWSRSAGGKYDTDANESQVRARWASFGQSGGVNVHYLKKLLKERGITNYVKRTSAAEDFADIEAEVVMPVGDLTNYWSEEIEVGEKADGEPKTKVIYNGYPLHVITNRFIEICSNEQMYAFSNQICLSLRDRSGFKGADPENFSNVVGWLTDLAGEPLGLRVDWRAGPNMVSKKDFGEHLVTAIRQVGDVTYVPAWPVSEDIVYLKDASKALNIPKGLEFDKLEGFLDFFNFTTPWDRKLAKAYIMCLLWNDTLKPGFMMVSSAGALGQNTGKSTFVSLANMVVTGSKAFKTIRFHKVNGKSVEQQIAEFLTADRSIVQFVADNISTALTAEQTQKYEDMLTNEMLTGHVNYARQKESRNRFVHVITTNTPSMTTDLASRFLTIMLDPPKSTVSGWLGKVEQYVKENRDEIVLEALSVLSREQEYEIDKVFDKADRFHGQVLSKLFTAEEWLDERDEVRAILKERKLGSDSSSDAVEEFDEYLRFHLSAIQEVKIEQYGEFAIKQSHLNKLLSEFSRNREDSLTSNVKRFLQLMRRSSTLFVKETVYRNNNIIVLSGGGPEGVRAVLLEPKANQYAVRPVPHRLNDGVGFGPDGLKVGKDPGLRAVKMEEG